MNIGTLPQSSSGPRAVVALLAALLGLMTGCAPGPARSSLSCPDDPVAAAAGTREPDFAPYRTFPKGRIGSIPCPGPFTFFATADPARLGTHRYGSSQGETGRGIIYTTRGGFIDIAHTRKAADWTAFHHVRFRHALENGWNCIVLPSKEGSVYTVRFRYPAPWRTMPPATRQTVIRDLSIQLAQHLAVTQTAWHEIATWFGYSATMYPEKPSAFTYDDMTSHLLGADLAGMALRDAPGDFEGAMTWRLKRELDRLGAVGPERTMDALARVDGQWWRNGFVIRRMVEIGGRNGGIRPWLVPGYPGGTAGEGVVFSIPPLDRLAGLDFSRFAEVEIDPRLKAWGLMRRALPDQPRVCRPARDFPILIDYIRRSEGAP